jgi:peptide/nickel transport system permease protein
VARELSLAPDVAAPPTGGPGDAAAPGREAGYWHAAWRILRRDRLAMVGLVLVVLLLLAAVFGPYLAPYSPTEQHANGLSPDGQPLRPSSEFWLGTDALGRDVLSRLLYGARASLAVGVLGNLLAAFFGVLLGGLAGIAGRFGEVGLMRIADLVLSFPVLLLAMTLLATTSPTLALVVLIVGISFGAYLSRIVFAQVSSLRTRDFVTAARGAGVGTPGVLARHVLPHVLPTVVVYAALGIATGIQLEAALSYVGIGVQPPNASWGNMIADGQSYLAVDPLLVAFPAICIVLAMFGFSLLGDGLRDALDPTLEFRLRAASRRGGT